MQMQHQIIQGDSRLMMEIPNESVHLVVTSPPYWQLKDYGTADQIGFHDSYEQYINHLNLVWQECYRVLHKGCRLCINIGDQFARAIYYGRYKVIPIREEIIKFCEHIGFDYMGAIIWQKVTTSHTTGGGVQMGSYPYPRNGILKLDYEFILVFKKLGDAPKPSKAQKELSKLTAEEWNTYFAGHWNFSGARQNSHIAMFPEELPRRLIKMFSFVGETVLDPFMGSGTTALAAKNTDRNAIGFEINPDFIPFIKEKMATEPCAFLIQKIKSKEDILAQKIKSLPYTFIDPHALDKKLGVKKRLWGTRIDPKGENTQQNLFTIKSILSPEKIMLNTGVVVQLMGIQTQAASEQEAIAFIQSKTQGKKVLIRHDHIKYNEAGELLGYLYLKNRTFINAHLIKNGLVKVDTSIDFKYKAKFEALSAAAKLVLPDSAKSTL